MQHRSALAAAVVLLLLPCTATLAQGVGYSLWEKPTGETQPSMSWNGMTGLTMIPSAAIGPQASFQVGAHWINTDWVIGTQEEDLRLYAGTVALTDYLEVGAARLENVQVISGGTPAFSDETVINAKWKANMGQWLGLLQAPDVCFGVWDITNEVNRAYYVVLSKPLHVRDTDGPPDLIFTIGLGNNELDQGAMDGVFVGVELAPTAMVKLQAEYDAEDFNGAIRLYPTRNLSLDFATIDGDFGAGASYRVGF